MYVLFFVPDEGDIDQANRFLGDVELVELTALSHWRGKVGQSMLGNALAGPDFAVLVSATVIPLG